MLLRTKAVLGVRGWGGVGEMSKCPTSISPVFLIKYTDEQVYMWLK